jgi:hypothetical protein
VVGTRPLSAPLTVAVVKAARNLPEDVATVI